MLSGFVVIVVGIILPETPLFLAQKGRYQEAKSILMDMLHVNFKSQPVSNNSGNLH